MPNVKSCRQAKGIAGQIDTRVAVKVNDRVPLSQTRFEYICIQWAQWREQRFLVIGCVTCDLLSVYRLRSVNWK